MSAEWRAGILSETASVSQAGEDWRPDRWGSCPHEHGSLHLLHFILFHSLKFFSFPYTDVIHSLFDCT